MPAKSHHPLPPASKKEVISDIVLMLRTDPTVKGCLQRVINSVLCNEIAFREKKQRLQTELEEHLTREYAFFFRDAIECLYLCGFVPFIVRRVRKIPTPFTLPLGTFTWHVQRDKWQARYVVKCDNSYTSDDNVHIFEMESPAVYHDNSRHVSPLQRIYEAWVLRHSQLMQIANSNRWNADKHVAVTEKIDFKDPTTSGLQLLDDFRQYGLSGRHSSISQNPFFTLRHAETQAPISNTNEATFAWAHGVFASDAGKAAEVHVMPPNTDITELQQMSANPYVQFCADHFNSEVHNFFDVPAQSQFAGTKAQNASEQMARQQYLTILNLCKFLERLGAFAYGKSFGVDERTVTVRLVAMPRLELKTIADLKTLGELNIITPSDKAKLRHLYIDS